MPLHRRTGFTLIELMITIAITGILTAIVFTGLRNEQQRGAVKDAVDRLQVDLLAMQNRMQSAIPAPNMYCTRSGGNYELQGQYCDTSADCLTDSGTQGRCVEAPPAAYGIELSTQTAAASTYYHIFADMPLGTIPANGYRSTAISLPPNPPISYDQIIQNGKRYGARISVVSLQAPAGDPNQNGTSKLTVTFAGNNAAMVIARTGGCTNTCASARIVLQNTTSGVCYAITLDRASGIVSRRQNSPTCT